jgi:hypothetical protein
VTPEISAREGYNRQEVLPSGFFLESIEQSRTRLTYVLQPDTGGGEFIQRILSLIRCRLAQARAEHFNSSFSTSIARLIALAQK